MEGGSSFRILTDASDLDYARAQFRCVTRPSAELPAPAYWDRDAHAYVPHDYEVQENDYDRFVARAAAETARLGAAYDLQWIDGAWKSYWDGVYGICLKSATPENIVLKNVLIDRIESLLASAKESQRWRALLMQAVDELDGIERPFCAFDRKYFGRPVSRDTYVDEVRRRYSTSVARNSPRAELPT
ncbi:MAG TPA: DUF6058 family natural product biosynthesis protein [Candidatus Baltobacteraceae bacterium]|nr:DUF6058 family natural product biosynthesis protein [Candidatus Baltobacteraceae bacterium]